jgi:hypothetical protein
MPEVSSDATILIATSWQAMHRARSGDPTTQLCDCTVMILFAAFYLEANLNAIHDALSPTSVAERIPDGEWKEWGVGKKLRWFYEEFIEAPAENEPTDSRYAKLGARFRGYETLYRFRNDLSHGTINCTARSVAEAEQLRDQTKTIVNELFAILRERGHEILRDTSYWSAIDGFSGAPQASSGTADLQQPTSDVGSSPRV